MQTNGALPCIIGCASGFADALESVSQGALEALVIGAFDVGLADCLALAGAGRDAADLAVLRYLLILWRW